MSKRAVSLAGKVGDVSSILDVAEAREQTTSTVPAETALGTHPKTPPQEASAVSEWFSLMGLLTKAKYAKRIAFMGTVLVLVMGLNVAGEIRLNAWQGAFYRAIEKKQVAEIGSQALVFVGIVAILLSFVVAQNWLAERLKLRIREGVTHALLNEWLAPGRAYRLNMTNDGLNPDQRIQEDVRNFSEMTSDLGIGALRSTLMLISFVGVLWGMSSGIAFDVLGRHIEIPGYMVWFAVAYAGLGTWLAAKVGSPLVAMQDMRYAREAGFRYSLVRVSDSAESVAFYGGEKDERKIIDRSLNDVLSTMRRISFANARLTTITVGHGWMVVILPVLAALPGYMQGKLDFGGLMMVVGAFNQVQQSLRWFVENFGRIADWRAAVHRAASFKETVSTVDEYEGHPETIVRVPHEEGRLAFVKTKVSLVEGEVVINDATAEIVPGERILLQGESGSGKSTLLRAVAGLWPWGGGEIKVPPQDETMFLPQRPYMPLGTLAAALAYPRADLEQNREKMAEVLRRVNLEAFVERLDETARWDKTMSLGQQQRFAFARLLLHRPKWIFLDEATSALDDDNQHRMMTLLVDDLQESAVLSVGHRQGLEQYHTRELHLMQTKSGRVLMKKPRKPPRASSSPIEETPSKTSGWKFRPRAIRDWMARPSAAAAGSSRPSRDPIN